MEIISLSVNIAKVESMSDKGLKVVMYTPELSAEDMTKLFKFNGVQSWCAIGENPINEMPKDLGEAIIQKPKEGKSYSQKLRNSLYVLRQYDDGGFKDFELFYNNRMDKIINQILEKVNNFN